MDRVKPIEVLIIDDDNELCDETQSLINKLKGYRSSCVNSGKEGLDYLKQHPDKDIVLLDIHLSNSENGVDVLKSIKKIYKNIQVIMLTSENAIDTGIECMKNGAYDYMVKPFNIEKFDEKVKLALQELKMKALQEDENAAKLTAMAEGLAHTVNNRLCDISLNATNLLEQIEVLIDNNEEEVKKNKAINKAVNNTIEITKAISNKVMKTGSVINGIVNYASIKRKNEYSRFLMDQLLGDVLGVFQTKSNVRKLPLKTNIESQELIYGNKSVLCDVLIGLLENAYEAVITMSEESDKKYEPLIELSYVSTASTNIIEVKDNGVGIRDEEKQKIFAPYYTTKISSRDSIGSGLYVIKRMIEENNGKILFESEYLKGSSFYVRIPKITQNGQQDKMQKNGKP